MKNKVLKKIKIDDKVLYFYEEICFKRKLKQQDVYGKLLEFCKINWKKLDLNNIINNN